ncbi:MAG TPA: hypothetical protein VGN52_00265 [Burkholderiales bacterium]|jgi:hypothetical protein
MGKYLRELVCDPLYMRVCAFLWGLPFVAGGVALFIALHRDAALAGRPPVWWIMLVAGGGLCLLGGWPMWTAVFANDERFERVTRSLGDGGDLIGLVFVLLLFVLALPATMLLRALCRHPGNSRQDP